MPGRQLGHRRIKTKLGYITVVVYCYMAPNSRDGDWACDRSYRVMRNLTWMVHEWNRLKSKWHYPNSNSFSGWITRRPTLRFLNLCCGRHEVRFALPVPVSSWVLPPRTLRRRFNQNYQAYRFSETSLRKASSSNVLPEVSGKMKYTKAIWKALYAI